MAILLESFPPSKDLEGFFRWFLFNATTQKAAPPTPSSSDFKNQKQTLLSDEEKIRVLAQYCLRRYDCIWRCKGKVRKLTKTDAKNLPKLPFQRCFFGGKLNEIMSVQRLEIIDFSTHLNAAISNDLYSTVRSDSLRIYNDLKVPKMFMLLMHSIFHLSNQIMKEKNSVNEIRNVFSNEFWDLIFRCKYQLESYSFLDSYQLLINNVNFSHNRGEKITPNISASLLALWLEELLEPIVFPLQLYYILQHKDKIGGIEFVIFRQLQNEDHMWIFLYLIAFFRKYLYYFKVPTIQHIATTFGPLILRAPSDDQLAVIDHQTTVSTVYEFILKEFRIPPQYEAEIMQHLEFPI